MATNQDVMDKLAHGDLQPNRWCQFGFHKWARWEVVRRASYDNGKRYVEVDRCCKQCGTLQLRTIKEKGV